MKIATYLEVDISSALTKSDVAQDDLQQRLLAQHSAATLATK